MDERKFEQEFGRFLEEQRRAASGMRLEQLQRDLTGEKKMLSTVIWPVMKSFDGLTLEYEMVSTAGVKIYVDVFYEPLRIAFESEGFVPHAENITRERFSFERMRVRTMMMYGYKYVPFTWDEMDKRPEACRRSVYELLGRFAGTSGIAYKELGVFEREVIRYALFLNKPFGLKDVCSCLHLGEEASRKVLRKLVDKELVKTLGKGKLRHHDYILGANAADYVL